MPRYLTILFLLAGILLPGCGGGAADSTNGPLFRTADVFAQGGEGTLELNRTTAGTQDAQTLGLLTAEGNAVGVLARDEQGRIVTRPPVGGEDPGDSGRLFPY